MLNNYGFTNVFENNDFVNPKVFPGIFKQKIIDILFRSGLVL